MFKIIISTFIFCIILFLYLHIQFHFKTSNDLEIYEIALPNRTKLEEVCNLKQPVLFEYYEESISKCTLDALSEYNAFDVMVFDDTMGILIPLEKARELFKTSMHASFHNEPFLRETMARRYYDATNAVLRPPMVTSMTQDLMFGSLHYTTKLQYHITCRNYIMVTQGSITVKLTPPRNTPFLKEIKKYETQEFISEIDPWTDDNKKVKFLELTVPVGRLLYIPAYWWYSIRLEKDACVCMFHYTTFSNLIATLPDIGMGVLQRHNTTTKRLPVVNLG
jgi:hypothetical protein